MRVPRVLAALVALVIVGACQLVAGPDGVPLGTEPLRAIRSPQPGELVGCMEALATGVLRGDPGDPSRVWLDARGDRIELGWPYDFGVRFDPGAVVVAPGGEVVAREDDALELGGGFLGGVFWICDFDGRSWPPYTP